MSVLTRAHLQLWLRFHETEGGNVRSSKWLFACVTLYHHLGSLINTALLHSQYLKRGFCICFCTCTLNHRCVLHVHVCFSALVKSWLITLNLNLLLFFLLLPLSCFLCAAVFQLQCIADPAGLLCVPPHQQHREAGSDAVHPAHFPPASGVASGGPVRQRRHAGHCLRIVSPLPATLTQSLFSQFSAWKVSIVSQYCGLG